MYLYNTIKNNKKIFIKKRNDQKAYKDLFIILSKIKKEKIFLVKKNKNQLNEIYKIQTESNARKYANTKKIITYQDHKIWFKKMLLSKSYHHFLIKKNVLTVGLVSYKPSKKGYIISIIIKKKYRNKNYAYTAIKMSLSNKEIINKKVLAIVKKNNINSIRLFRKLKFSLNSKKKLYMKLS